MRTHYNAFMPLATNSIKTVLDRPARLRGLALLTFLVVVLAILGSMIWRNLQRLDTIQAYVTYSHLIQDAGLDLQRAMMDSLSGHDVTPAHMAELEGRLRELVRVGDHLDPVTPTRLQRVASLLRNKEGNTVKRTALFDALRVMHETLDAETERREQELEELSRNTLAELEAATVSLVVVLLLALIFLRHRILAPLHDLRQLLLSLAKESYSPIRTEHLDPLLLPVFNSYNVMVTHLSELEEAKRMHAQSLEAEVRAATQALLEQQRSLARAERLAAVGELAAGLAHELRNPLAGIQMSCANLRDEVELPEQAERLDLIGAELKRMGRLLNDLLGQSRQTPMPPTHFKLGCLVNELLTLARYQIPPYIELTCQVPEELACHLPEGNLRQALLNLILNAAQALDHASGQIMIRAWQEQGALCIEVSDDGPGFSEDMLSAGIRPFYTGRAQGTGLGLAMVQRFVRECHGQIKLVNRQPHGASVMLSLPDMRH